MVEFPPLEGAAAGARAPRPRPVHNSLPLEGCPKGGVVGDFAHEEWHFVFLTKTTPSAFGVYPSEGGEFGRPSEGGKFIVRLPCRER
jgi:hypothetical protein